LPLPKEIPRLRGLLEQPDVDPVRLKSLVVWFLT
jgi:hypothetical protein